MPQPEQPISHLKLIREVDPSKDIENFMARSRRKAEIVFGVKRSLPVRRPVSLNDELDPDYTPIYDGVAIPRATTLPIEMMGVVLFSRQAVATPESNEILEKAYRRLTANKVRSSRSRRNPSGQKVETYRENTLPTELSMAEVMLESSDGDMRYYSLKQAGKLAVSAVGVVRNPRNYDTGEYQEYSLELSPDVMASRVLRRQAEIVNKYTRATVAGKALFRHDLGLVDGGDVLQIPFMTVEGSDSGEHELFADNLIGEFVQPLKFVVGVPRWDLVIRQPAN